jgi:flagella basal body P-ring formation protein FlgA
VNDALRRQAEARVRTAVIDYLRGACDATAAWQVRFTLTDDQVQLVIRSSAKPLVHGGAEPWTGTQRFAVTVATADSAHQITLEATVAPAEQIVVANRAIGRGERLSEADVRLAAPSYIVAPETALHSLEQVVGRETTRSLAVDSPITTDVVQSPLLVRKRDIVTVYARSPGIRVRTTGRATEDGALGDLILIESLAQRQTFFARVCGPQEAEIYARAPQADQVSPAVAAAQNATLGGR